MSRTRSPARSPTRTPRWSCLLGYTNIFTRTHQWQDQAQYVMGEREVCGFRQVAEWASRARPSSSCTMPGTSPQTTRDLFQGLVRAVPDPTAGAGRAVSAGRSARTRNAVTIRGERRSSGRSSEKNRSHVLQRVRPEDLPRRGQRDHQRPVAASNRLRRSRRRRSCGPSTNRPWSRSNRSSGRGARRGRPASSASVGRTGARAMGREAAGRRPEQRGRRGHPRSVEQRGDWLQHRAVHHLARRLQDLRPGRRDAALSPETQEYRLKERERRRGGRGPHRAPLPRHGKDEGHRPADPPGRI